MVAQPAVKPAPAAPALAVRATTVMVDPRIELLGVLQVLSGYFLTSHLDTKYKSDVKEYFAPYAKHAAIALFGEMTKEGFRFSEVPTAIYAFSPPPDLVEMRPLTTSTLEAAGGREQLLRLISAMREFHHESGFQSFFPQHAGFYASAVKQSSPTIQQVTDRLEKYLGTSLGDTAVVLGLLLHDGGFAAAYPRADAQPEVVAFVGPEKVTEGQPDFGSADRIDSLITHEFAHTIINPITSRHSALLQERAPRFEPIRARMQENGYGTWEQSVYEHIIRAITARLAGIRSGDAAEQTAINDELKRGFVYVPLLVEQLKVYEAHRAKYPTIETYFPVLLQAFDTVVPQPPVV